MAGYSELGKKSKSNPETGQKSEFVERSPFNSYVFQSSSSMIKNYLKMQWLEIIPLFYL